jgi:RNA polymerase sigma-70 factor (ECF subfamily)
MGPPVLLLFFLLLLHRNRSTSVYSGDLRSDEDLYRRYAEGDDRAFRVLLDRHGGAVLAYLTRYFGDREMATDLTQDVFLKVIAGAEGFRGDSHFRTYLFRIVRNLCFDVLRSRKGRPDAGARSLDGPVGPHGDGRSTVGDLVPGTGISGAQRVLTGELSAAIQSGLALLPADQREVFLMRQVEGLRFPEIAQILGVNENTVKGRMLAAVKSLRQSLAEFRERP